MAKSYTTHFSTRETPQDQKIPGSNQVPNSGGGFSWEVDDWMKLDRFILLGNEGGSYYASEQKMTVDNAQAVMRCLNVDAKRTVSRIVEISYKGLAPKQEPAIFALAMAAGHPEGKKHALAPENFDKVLRIGTHLFTFWEMVKAFRGRGPTLHKAVNSWYLSQPPEKLAYGVCKYQQRNGWSHKDILRLTKPANVEGVHNSIFKWVVGKAGLDNLMGVGGLEIIVAFERAKKATDKKEIVKLIREYGLVRECIPTQFLTEADVWEALLEKMPLTAMIRNLATMTRVGLLSPMSQAVGKVLSELSNVERLRKSRVHPILILSALLTYKQGHGVRGGNTWAPVSQICDALDGSFYLSFGNVEPTHKRWLLALDVSGSMDGGTIAGVPGLSPRVGSSAMALITAATEAQHLFVAFTSNGEMAHPSMHHGYPAGITQLAISPRQRLDDVCNQVRKLPMGGTDCALPMLWAAQKKIPVDVFVCYTDSETWANPKIHPSQALQQYREKMGINAKMIVVGMVANNFTIADPKDPHQMDVVGFDSSAPLVMSQFVRGEQSPIPEIEDE